jgi:hypothetical protein
MVNIVRSEQFIGDREVTLTEQLFGQSPAKCLEVYGCRHVLSFHRAAVG